MILNHSALPLLGASLGMRSSPNLADPSGVNSEFSTLLVHKLFSFTYYQVDALGFHPALLLLSCLPESSRPHLHLFCLPLVSRSVLDVPLVLRFSLLYLCIFNMKSILLHVHITILAVLCFMLPLYYFTFDSSFIFDCVY